jgi:hypothetical protein
MATRCRRSKYCISTEYYSCINGIILAEVIAKDPSARYDKEMKLICSELMKNRVDD